MKLRGGGNENLMRVINFKLNINIYIIYLSYTFKKLCDFESNKMNWVKIFKSESDQFEIENVYFN